MIMIDIDMPDNCDECRFTTECGFCKAMPDNFCGMTDNRKRPEWCPLKEQEELLCKLQNDKNKLCLEVSKWKHKFYDISLKEQEVRELTIEEWREWKADSRRDPICMLWENDIYPMWILIPDDVHEPALLMGKLKLFTGRPTFEQCKAVKWND